jgi:hypothetical protein
MATCDYHSKDSPQNHNSPNISPSAQYYNRPGKDSASQAEHSSARKRPRICCETSSHKLTATAHINSRSTRNLMEEDLIAESSPSSHKLTLRPQSTDKRPKAKASEHTGNILPHNSVPNVRTITHYQHYTTFMHTGSHNFPVKPASSTLPLLPIMSSKHPHSTPQHDLHLTLRSTVLSHLQSLEFHLLHTIHCILSPLVVYSILSPP